MKRTSRKKICVAVLLAAAVPNAATAQVLYGSIVGNVKDSTEAIITGASVTATNVETGLARQATTNEFGMYSFSTVQAGVYRIHISKEGFTAFTRSDVPIAINSVARIDAILSVGTIVESVTVGAESAVLQADRAEVRAEITSKTLIDLPGSLNRNYQYLLNTIPGVSPSGTRDNNPSNATGSSIFNVNGASNQINNTRIDGASTHNIWQPQYVAYNPPLEAIQVVNVVTNSYDAEQGLAGGAAINVQLKSGTNEFHGSLFEYHHNQHMRARGYFLPEGVQMGKYILNQYGGTAGGPIKRDKVFFFTSFENSTDRRARDTIASVPSLPVRNGDMSAYPTIYDPLTGNADGSGRTPFANNRIPDGSKDPIVQKIIPLVPMPNLPGETQNYFVSGGTTTDRWAWDNKVNWNPSERTSVWGRFSLMDLTYLNSTIFGEQLVGNVIQGGNPGTGGSNIYNVSAGFTHIFTPAFLVDGNVGYVKHNTGVEQPAIDKNIGLDVLGIPGTNGPARYQGGWPKFSSIGYSEYGTFDGYMPYWRWDNQQQTVVNSNWTRGAHELRWGADVYWQGMNHTQPEGPGFGHGPRGTFVFGSGPTRLCTNPDGRGGCLVFSTDSVAHSYATFLLGLPTRLGKQVMTIEPFSTRQWEYSFYIRDKWQVGRKLTLSFGTRWEYFPVPTRADRGLENYNPDTNKVEIGGIGAVPKDLGVKVSKRMFAPRFGFAYRPTNTLVIRGGYGITNDPYSMARSMRSNYPVIIELDRNSPNSWQPIGKLTDGIPAVPISSLGDGIIDIPLNVSANAIPSEFRRGYIQSWNFTLQKELPGGFVAEAGYVATRQVRQLGSQELNWSPVGAGQAGQILFQKFGRTAATRMVTPVGGTHYDSLQARLQRRFRSGVFLETSYTWGKSITNSGTDNSDGRAPIAIPEYYALNRSVSSFDRTHNVQISYIAELPFGKGKRFARDGGVASAVLGGWQINGLLSFYTGAPFSISSSGTSLNAPNSTQRADQVKAEVEKLGGVGRGQAFFDPLAFAPVNERRFGTAGFLSMRGPGMANWDGGLFRNFRVKEELAFQLRFDALNVTNTPHFANPGGNVSNLRLNADGTVRDLNGFSEVLSASGERQLRLGVRVSW